MNSHCLSLQYRTFHGIPAVVGVPGAAKRITQVSLSLLMVPREPSSSRRKRINLNRLRSRDWHVPKSMIKLEGVYIGDK